MCDSRVYMIIPFSINQQPTTTTTTTNKNRRWTTPKNPNHFACTRSVRFFRLRFSRSICSNVALVVRISLAAQNCYYFCTVFNCSQFYVSFPFFELEWTDGDRKTIKRDEFYDSKSATQNNKKIEIDVSNMHDTRSHAVQIKWNQ